MDYLDPIRALMPGIDGAVLSVLAHTDGALTLRQIAERSGASHPQVSHHVARFEDLGLIQRQVVGRGHLIRLTDSAPAQWVRALAGLREAVLERMRDAAAEIVPAPDSIVVFGSFARGTAGRDSDIDVLVLAPSGLADDESWLAQVAEWTDRIAAFAGNPVAELIWEVDDLSTHRGEPLWHSIATDGIVVAGRPLPFDPRTKPRQAHHAP